MRCCGPHSCTDTESHSCPLWSSCWTRVPEILASECPALPQADVGPSRHPRAQAEGAPLQHRSLGGIPPQVAVVLPCGRLGHGHPCLLPGPFCRLRAGPRQTERLPGCRPPGDSAAGIGGKEAHGTQQPMLQVPLLMHGLLLSPASGLGGQCWEPANFLLRRWHLTRRYPVYTLNKSVPERVRVDSQPTSQGFQWVWSCRLNL